MKRNQIFHSQDILITICTFCIRLRATRIACIFQICCCLSVRKWKFFFSTFHWYKSKYKDFFASMELQDEKRDSQILGNIFTLSEK